MDVTVDTVDGGHSVFFDATVEFDMVLLKVTNRDGVFRYPLANITRFITDPS